MATKKSLSKKGYKKGGRKTNGRKTRGRKVRKTYKKNMKGGDCGSVMSKTPSSIDLEGGIFYVGKQGKPVKTPGEADMLDEVTYGDDGKATKIQKSNCPKWVAVVGDNLAEQVRTMDPEKNLSQRDFIHNDYPGSCCK